MLSENLPLTNKSCNLLSIHGILIQLAVPSVTALDEFKVRLLLLLLKSSPALLILETISSLPELGLITIKYAAITPVRNTNRKDKINLREYMRFTIITVQNFI
jgi:hypothetical protein